VIFSNAAFHWITDQKQLLDSLYTALRDNSSLVCEFGAHGNIKQIETAYTSVTKARQKNYESPFYFPTTEEYYALLRQTGFQIEHLYDFDRPTPLPGGKDGLRKWMPQFFGSDLVQYSPDDQSEIFCNVEETLKNDAFDGTNWVADYRRLRAIARK